MEGNTLFNLEGTGRRMLEKGKRADGASANNIKAQRSGFGGERRSSGVNEFFVLARKRVIQSL